MALTVFFSYNFEDEHFVRVVAYLLGKQPDLRVYCYSDDKRGDRWPQLIAQRIEEADAFVFFAGKTIGKYQEREINIALNSKREHFDDRVVGVRLAGALVPDSIRFLPLHC